MFGHMTKLCDKNVSGTIFLLPVCVWIVKVCVWVDVCAAGGGCVGGGGIV